jgi:hypothetical protein
LKAKSVELGRDFAANLKAAIEKHSAQSEAGPAASAAAATATAEAASPASEVVALDEANAEAKA